MNYIDEYSWKSFLSVQAKNIQEINNGFYLWEMKGVKQLVKSRNLELNDIDFIKSLGVCNFFYFPKEDIDLLKKQGIKITSRKDPEAVIPIEKIEFKGRKYHGIRSALNKANKLNLTIENELRNIEDLKQMLKIWSDTSGEKYFQDRSGKHMFFFKNEFHKGCLNTFVYLEDKLVGFAVISPPKNGFCSYVIGKALCIPYPGLSEYIDVIAYKEAQKVGGKLINLGGGGKNLIKYKSKFPGAYLLPTYDGKIL